MIRNSSGLYTGETAWSKNTPSPGEGGVGGPSQFIARPAFQGTVARIVGTARGVPDISFDANPETGVWIYVTNPTSSCTGFCIIGGTSVSSPALAGVTNSANTTATSSQEELSLIYTKAIHYYRSDWNDIIVGQCQNPTLPRYDMCTGLGSPNGYAGFTN